LQHAETVESESSLLPSIGVARGRVQGTKVHPQGERIASNIAIFVARGRVHGSAPPGRENTK